MAAWCGNVAYAVLLISMLRCSIDISAHWCLPLLVLDRCFQPNLGIDARETCSFSRIYIHIYPCRLTSSVAMRLRWVQGEQVVSPEWRLLTTLVSTRTARTGAWDCSGVRSRSDLNTFTEGDNWLKTTINLALRGGIKLCQDSLNSAIDVFLQGH